MSVLPGRLGAAMLHAVAQPGASVAFRVRRRDFYRGRWLKHVQASAFYQRLFRPSKMRYERLVNPVSIPDGEVGEVDGYLDHYPFSKGVGLWIDRHNRYSTFEAMQVVENRRKQTAVSVRTALLGRDFHEKRYHQKESVLPLARQTAGEVSTALLREARVPGWVSGAVVLHPAKHLRVHDRVEDA